MGVQPVDFASGLAGGQALVPNYAEEVMRQALLGIQQQEAATGLAREQRLSATAGREQQRQAEFQARVQALGQNPGSAQLVALMAAYPEFSEGLRRAFQSQDEVKQRTDRSQLAEIAFAASNGNYTVATETWRRRIAADEAAGDPPSPIESGILADLESGDPARQREAAQAIGYLYASTGSNTNTDLETLGIRQRTETVTPGDVVFNPDTGEIIGQSPASRVLGNPEDGFSELAPDPNIPVIGGRATPPPASTPSAASPGSGASFRDPVYDTLAAPVERELGLPTGLLAAIRTRGERSNADQVSEAGARTVYQFIPETRAAILQRYGVDAYAGPEQATRAAGLLLRENYQRSGNWEQAVREYHGGTDSRRHGPRTRAYVGRVMAGLNASGPTRIRSVQEYNRLASGTEYIDPNGVPRRKP